MAAAAYLDTVQKIYIAFYQRPADPGGLQYWAERLDGAKGNLSVIINEFANSAETQAIYGPITSTTIGGVIDQIYQALFNRAPDAAGKAWYVSEFTSGHLTAGNIAHAILDGARNADATAIANKLAVANKFTAELDTPVEQNAYNLSSAALVRALLADVTASTNPATFNVQNTISQITTAQQTHVFTLQEAHESPVSFTPAVTAIYWGYTPDGTEPGVGKGIPVAELIKFVTTITGLDLKELGLIDADGTNPFANVTSLSISNPLSVNVNQNQTQSGNDNGSSSPSLTIHFADGTFVNAEVALGQAYFGFLNDLLYYEVDGVKYSRLYEKVVVPASVKYADGTVQYVGPSQGSSLPPDYNGYDVYKSGPIKLTPYVNNNATAEAGRPTTTAGDDTIFAGRLELLHGAYIDGGAGYNTLEVQAKGVYAQPLQLINIQQIIVTDLPNFYTKVTDSQGGYTWEDIYQQGGVIANPTLNDSWLDLTNARQLEKLVITDQATGGQSGSPFPGATGNLYIVGIRNNATARIEGGLRNGESVTLQYGQGLDGNGLNIELVVGTVDGTLNLLNNASVLNINSIGTENYLNNFFVGGNISRINVTGNAVFGAAQDISYGFNAGRPAVIDASANTGGLDITFNGQNHDNDVTVKGTVANDEITVNNVQNGDVLITAGEGRNKVQAINNVSVEITAGAGKDDIDASGSKDVTIDAGAGANTITVNQADLYHGTSTVSITTAGGNDTITALRNGSVTIDAGAGNNTIAVSALQASITTGAGNDKVTVSGLHTSFDYGDLGEGGNGAGGWNDGNTDHRPLNGHFADFLAPGVVLNLDLGAGTNTLVLGRDWYYGSNQKVDFGVTALEGSSIRGTGITLYVENNSDLTQADLSGATIGKVTLKQELRITADQFKAIGADKFAVEFDEEGATEDLYIVVSSSVTLSELVSLNALNTNVRLHFELRNGATLTLSAAELHKYVAENGIYSSPSLAGKIVITDAGGGFDPWDNGQDYGVIDGGTLTGDFEKGQVTVIRSPSGGFERPKPGDYSDTLTLGDAANTAPLVISSKIVSEANTLKLVGSQDIQFKAIVDLGGEVAYGGKDVNVNQKVGGVALTTANGGQDTNPTLQPNSVETDAFVVDFSALTGKVTGLTLDHFQDVKEVKGNGIAGTRINVILNADVGSNDGTNTAGFKTSGVEQYVVTKIDVNQDGIADGLPGQGWVGNSKTLWFTLGDQSKDVKVLGLQGNVGSTLVFKQVPWSVVAPVILLEGDGHANWNEGLESDGNPETSNIGKVVVEFFTPGAPAVVNINNRGTELGVTSTGGERKFSIDGIEVKNAKSLTVNVTEGDATIKGIATSAGDTSLKTLSFTATEDVTVTGDLPQSLTKIDGAGITGKFAVEVNKQDGVADDDFSFTGSTGGSTLKFTGDFTADNGKADGTTTSINGGTGGVQIETKGTTATDLASTTEVNLKAAALTNVTGVTLGNNSTVTLTLAQADAIGASHFKLALGATAAKLELSGLAEQKFSVADYAKGISVGLVELADQATITLHPETDLTGVAKLQVHEGTVLNLTAKQFQQLKDAGAIEGFGSPATKNFTVNITGLTQADIDPLDLNGDGLYDGPGEHAGFDLSGITANKVTVTLAEDVKLKGSDKFGGDTNLSKVTVEIGGHTLTLADIAQANGLKVNGGAGGVLQFNDASLINNNDATFTIGGVTVTGKIDASHFNVEILRILNVLVAGQNIDKIFLGLPQEVQKVIYTGLGWVNGVNQTVTIEAGTTVPGFLTLDKVEPNVEIRNFTLNLQGGTEITGALKLTGTAEVDGSVYNLHKHLETVVINSTGTGTNLLTGKATNVITGNITGFADDNPFADITKPGGSNEANNNNLLNVTINAAQALQVNGAIVFSSVVGDDAVTANDNKAAIATLTINGSANVSLGNVQTGLGGVNTQDDDVDGLVVTNAGTGTLKITLNAADIDQTPANNDHFEFQGSHIELSIIGAIDLSDDGLAGVSKISVSDTGSSALTLNYAQFQALTAANIVVVDGADGNSTIENAALTINGYTGGAFDATTLDSHFNSVNLVLANQNVTLDAGVNLTNVDEIKVQEGTTLTLTAAQFQQLKGHGKITAVDTNGDSTFTPINVVITGLTQADVNRDLDSDGFADADDGFSLADIDTHGGKITVTLGENDVTLGKLVNGVLVGASVSSVEPGTNNKEVHFTLTDGQTLGVASHDQADGLIVDGTGTTTVVYRFTGNLLTSPFNGQINASGYHVTVLKALAGSFGPNGSQSVEYSIDDLPSSVELRLYNDPANLGFLNPTYRVVVIEQNITTPTGLIFNDWDAKDEVRTLDITLQGGVTLNGDLSIPTRTGKDGSLVQQYFDTLTIHSSGATANKVQGNISTNSLIANPNTADNNLLKIAIDASQALSVTGGIVFRAVDALYGGATTPHADAVASLTITGAGNVTVQQLNVSDNDIATLNVANNGTGTFTVTGGSPALLDGGALQGQGSTAANLEVLNLSGTGNIVFGDLDSATSPWGISAGNLSKIDASGLSGSLNLGQIKDIDSRDFSFKSGTGVTKLSVTDDELNADDTATPAGNIQNAKWSFDLSNAAANSELHLNSNVAYGKSDDLAALDRSNSLEVKLGANATLYLDGANGTTIDFTNLESLVISGANQIVLADGVTLKLTAAQASGLKIKAGVDDATNGVGYSGKIEIVGLENDSAATPHIYDFSKIDASVKGTISLATNDVTVNAATDLGGKNLSVLLTQLFDDRGDTTVTGDVANGVAGQTIRFNTTAQAERGIVVKDSGDVTNSSTNVIWLFKSLAGDADGIIDTVDYDKEIGRVWLTKELIQSVGGIGNVEALFTTLQSQILRADFATLAELEALLKSAAVDRILEVASFRDLPNLTFADIAAGPLEHVRSLTLKLGGQAAVGNVNVYDIVNAKDDPASYSFTGITIDSYRSVKTGDLYAAKGYNNNNDGVIQVGEHAQPNNINTVGNLGVNAPNPATNPLHLLTVTLNTHGQTVIGDGSAGAGAALKTGTITFEAPAPAKVGDPLAQAQLFVKGANDITVTSVDTSDVDINYLGFDATGFTATLSAPGASPAVKLGSSVETFVIKNGGVQNTTTAAFQVKADGADDNDETLTVNYILNGVAGSKTINLAGIDVTNANDVAVAVANALDADTKGGIPGFDAAVSGGDTVTLTAKATNTDDTFVLVNVVAGGTVTSLAGKVTDGTTLEGGAIKLGTGTANAGVAGSDVSFIDASGFGGYLDLGTLAQIDSTNDDRDGNGDALDAGDEAFTFTSGTGTNIVRLGAANGLTPTLEAGAGGKAGSTWVFDFTNTASKNSKLILDSSTVFKSTANAAENPTLVVKGGDLFITGAVDLTKVNLSVTDGDANGQAQAIHVEAGNTLTLTVAQALALGADVVGEGTVKIVGDATNANGATLGAHLKTVNVDFTGVTLDTKLDDTFNVVLTGATNDKGTLPGADATKTQTLGQNVLGVTAYKNDITTGTGNDTLTGGDLDDTLTGGSNGVTHATDAAHANSDTYIVTKGTDTIVGLGSQLDDKDATTFEEQDVLIVKSGATAKADGIVTFVATAATTNDGKALLTGAVGTNSLIDVSKATGSKGFTLTGASDAAHQSTLIGSDRADIINGGDDSQAGANGVDVLTGGKGGDTFVFNVLQSKTATLTIETKTVAVDQEVITIVGDVNDGDNETVKIDYKVNSIAGSVTVDLGTTDVKDANAVASFIASVLNKQTGISATSTLDKVYVQGQGGNSVGNIALTWTNADAAGLDASTITNGTDVKQVTTLTVGTTAGDAVTGGEQYSTLLQYIDQIGQGKPGYSDTYVAGGGDTVDTVATQITNGLIDAGYTTVSVTDNVVTITGETPDKGGFTLTGGAVTAFKASGASDVSLALISADIITDFNAVEDTLAFTGLQAGKLGNYLEAAGVTGGANGMGDYATAISNANAAFTGTAQYYLTSVKADAAIISALDAAHTAGYAQAAGITDGKDLGVLFFDANLDGTADGVVVLVGVTSTAFDAANIVTAPV